jgi:hypothetical protein
MGRPLWREDGSVICICCWSLTAQSISGQSHLGLVTIFYCLRFQTSLFVLTCWTVLPQTIFFLLFITLLHGLRRKRRSSIVARISLRGNAFIQLLPCNSCTRHILYHDTSPIAASGRCLATAASLPPQFLLWANTSQYKCRDDNLNKTRSLPFTCFKIQYSLSSYRSTLYGLSCW